MIFDVCLFTEEKAKSKDFQNHFNSIKNQEDIIDKYKESSLSLGCWVFQSQGY
jgi:hypothetical protein